MKKLGLALLSFAVAAALLFGTGGMRTQTQAQEEAAPQVQALSPSTCLAAAATQSAQIICLALTSNANIGSQRDGITAIIDTDDDGEPTPEEWSGSNTFTGRSLFEQDGSFIIIAYVEDDEPLLFETEQGLFRLPSNNLVGQFFCNQPPFAEADGSDNDSDGQIDEADEGVGAPATDDLQRDEDCDGDGLAGDGVVYGHLIGPCPGGGACIGDEYGEGVVHVFETETGNVIGDRFYEVTGEPEDITVAAFEPNIGAGLNPDDCSLPTSADGFLEAIGHPQKTVVIARISDTNDMDLSNAWVHWEVSDTDKAMVAAPDTPTLDLGSFGLGAPQIICGLEGSGEVEIEVSIQTGPDPGTGFAGIYPASGDDVSTTTVNLIAVPANLSLSVDPPVLTCDGVASASVSATVTTAEGDPVAGGTIVDFSVQVLGTANPLSAATNDEGVATTTVTPFAVADTGVPVIVSVGDPQIPVIADDDGLDNDNDDDTDEPGERDEDTLVPNPDFMQASILVQCGAGSAPPPPPGGEQPGGGGAGPGGETPGGTISPPDTGSGGDIDGQGALSVWTAIALFTGAMALVGARLALRRA